MSEENVQEWEGDFGISVDNGEVTIEDYRGESMDVCIPAEIRGLPVTVIGEHAFYRKKLESVVIPESVTEIGALAFCGNGLESIVIPNSVTEIGSQAFARNPLTSITIGGGVSISDLAEDNFDDAYEATYRKAGTYTRPDDESEEWTLE